MTANIPTLQNKSLVSLSFPQLPVVFKNKKILKGYTETVSQHRHPRAVKMPYNVLVIIL